MLPNYTYYNYCKFARMMNRGELTNSNTKKTTEKFQHDLAGMDPASLPYRGNVKLRK